MIRGTSHRLVFEDTGPYHPRRTFAELLRWQDLFLDEAADRRFAHLEDGGRFLERHLATFRPFTVPVGCNLPMVAQRTNPRSCPTVPAARHLASAIEDSGNCRIRHLPRQDLDEFDHIRLGAPAVLPPTVLADAQRGMIVPGPPDDESERIVLDGHDDLLDQGPDDPLSGCRRRVRTMPGALDIGSERQKLCTLRDGHRGPRGRLEGISLLFETMRSEETLVPAMFEFGRHEPVVGVDRVVLPSRAGDFVASLLEGKLDVTPLLGILDTAGLSGGNRRVDAERLKALDHLRAHGLVDPHPSKRDASIAAMVELTAAAVIAARTAVLSTIGDVELPAAMAATKETRQQRFAATDRPPAHEAPAIGIVADQALIPFELRPANVALVMIKNQSVPCAPLEPKAAHDPLAAGLDRHPAAGAAECVGSGIDRVGQDVMDGL